jgi:hypothetical protein
VIPPALEAFSRLPFWSFLFVGLAAALAVFSGWSLWRRRDRQDFYYLLLGIYLLLVLPPLALPAVASELSLDTSRIGLGERLIVALPAITLFVMGVRSR